MKSLHTALLAATLLCPLAAVAAPTPADEASRLEALYFDEVVESATRAPKPLSQIAENVTVVTAEEIEAMNAHTLAEVLNRVTGVFVQFQGIHFGAVGQPHIQGSGAVRETSERHSSLLLDGVPWNTLSAEVPLHLVPVGMIDRIEILRGSASSTWGSALGGVINVLTKRVGAAAVPGGFLSGSYGERNTWDVRAEAAGAAGPVGYYAQAQGQHADWQDAGAEYSSKSLFGKVEAPLGGRASLTLTAGHSRPEVDAGHLRAESGFAQDSFLSRFVRASFDARLGPAVALHAGAFLRAYRKDGNTQEDGTYAPAGALLQNNTFDERTSGAEARGSWLAGGHTVVAGIEYVASDLTQTTDSGEYYQSEDGGGWPARAEFDSHLDRVGLYANDTVRLGALTLTPGLRHDRFSRGDSFTSPSLGATWRVGRDTVVRASAARGFALPPQTFVSGGGFGLEPNPDLAPERVFSWQGGAETVAFGVLWLKAMAFRHEVAGSIEKVGPRYENGGSARRTGFEAEAETADWRGLSGRVGFAFVRAHKVGEDVTEDQHQVNLGLAYRRGTLSASLLGHYVWWDLDRSDEEGGHNDLLWDLTGSKSVSAPWGAATEVFGSVHNLFNGDQQTDVDRGTEPRWVEAGVRVRF